MIRLLLLLAALSELGASTDTMFLFGDPITLFGKEKTRMYVTTSSTNAYICFDDYYASGPADMDCITLTGNAAGATSTSHPLSSLWEAKLKIAFSSIPTQLQSVTSLKITLNSDLYTLEFYSAGLHSGLTIETSSQLGTDVMILIGGQQLKNQKTGAKFVFDLSGCRKKDSSVVAFKSENKLGNCKKEECKTPGNVAEVACGTNEYCISDSCKSKATCTFTGPSVIDYKGLVGEIKDECDYRLMASKVLPDFSVEGTFGERRRKDKSFLDSVVLKLKSTTYSLKQGGIVTEGSSPLTLTDKPLVKGLITFIKSTKGVTAKYSEKGMDVVVFFNGYTAQIDFTGPPSTDPGLKYLCGKAQSEVTDVRIVKGSCTTKKTDKEDKTIDCNKAKASCSILSGDPFTSCHKLVSPSGFVKACSDTMCGYPAVDGLTCYFLESYSRACSLYSTKGVTGWRSKAGCPTEAKAICQDKPCASSEFCGQIGASKAWGCRCKPTPVQKYRDDGALGDATTCGSGSASASLVNCLLLEKGIDYKTLQLNDASCQGDLVDGKVVFKFDSTKTCGAVVTDIDGAVNYKNNIKAKQLAPDTIQRQDPVDISFACDFAQPKLQLMSFKVTGSSSVVNKPMKSGTFKYQLIMTAYSNEGLTDVLKSVELNQRVWIKLEAKGVDSKLSAVLFDSCWATKQADPNKAPKYFLVSKGCKNPKDDTVILTGNGAGIQAVFSFMAFQFRDSKSEVYLHCKVSMCGVKKDKSCVPSCTTSRKRRDASRLIGEEDSSLITMAWGN